MRSACYSMSETSVKMHKTSVLRSVGLAINDRPFAGGSLRFEASRLCDTAKGPGPAERAGEVVLQCANADVPLCRDRSIISQVAGGELSFS